MRVIISPAILNPTLPTAIQLKPNPRRRVLLLVQQQQLLLKERLSHNRLLRNHLIPRKYIKENHLLRESIKLSISKPKRLELKHPKTCSIWNQVLKMKKEKKQLKSRQKKEKPPLNCLNKKNKPHRKMTRQSPRRKKLLSLSQRKKRRKSSHQ